MARPTRWGRRRECQDQKTECEVRGANFVDECQKDDAWHQAYRYCRMGILPNGRRTDPAYAKECYKECKKFDHRRDECIGTREVCVNVPTPTKYCLDSWLLGMPGESTEGGVEGAAGPVTVTLGGSTYTNPVEGLYAACVVEGVRQTNQCKVDHKVQMCGADCPRRPFERGGVGGVR